MRLTACIVLEREKNSTTPSSPLACHHLLPALACPACHPQGSISCLAWDAYGYQLVVGEREMGNVLYQVQFAHQAHGHHRVLQPSTGFADSTSGTSGNGVGLEGLDLPPAYAPDVHVMQVGAGGMGAGRARRRCEVEARVPSVMAFPSFLLHSGRSCSLSFLIHTPLCLLFMQGEDRLLIITETQQAVNPALSARGAAGSDIPAGPGLNLQHVTLPQQYIDAAYPLVRAGVGPLGGNRLVEICLGGKAEGE